MERKTKFKMVPLAMLLAVGVGQFGVLPSFAQSNQPAQVEPVDACVLYITDDELASEAQATPEVELQATPEAEMQVTPEAEMEATLEADIASAFVGSIPLNEAQFDGMTDAEECAALISLATVTPEAARAAAETETGSVAVKVEIDDQNGFLVYEVEMESNVEVIVDAGDATILMIRPEAEDEEDAEDGENVEDTEDAEDGEYDN